MIQNMFNQLNQAGRIANKLQCSHKSEIVPTAINFGLTHILNEFHLTTQN